MKGKNVYRLFLVLALSLFSFIAIEAQSPVRTTYIKGVVIDSLSREPLSYVAVFLKGSDKGLQTDDNGRFEIQTKVNFINLQFSTLGYSSKEIFVNELGKNGWSVLLDTELENSYGTVIKLGKAILEDSDWTVDETNSSNKGTQEVTINNIQGMVIGNTNLKISYPYLYI